MSPWAGEAQLGTRASTQVEIKLSCLNQIKDPRQETRSQHCPEAPSPVLHSSTCLCPGKPAKVCLPGCPSASSPPAPHSSLPNPKSRPESNCPSKHTRQLGGEWGVGWGGRLCTPIPLLGHGAEGRFLGASSFRGEHSQTARFSTSQELDPVGSGGQPCTQVPLSTLGGRQLVLGVWSPESRTGPPQSQPRPHCWGIC